MKYVKKALNSIAKILIEILLYILEHWAIAIGVILVIVVVAVNL